MMWVGEMDQRYHSPDPAIAAEWRSRTIISTHSHGTTAPRHHCVLEMNKMTESVMTCTSANVAWSESHDMRVRECLCGCVHGQMAWMGWDGRKVMAMSFCACLPPLFRFLLFSFCFRFSFFFLPSFFPFLSFIPFTPFIFLSPSSTNISSHSSKHSTNPTHRTDTYDSPLRSTWHKNEIKSRKQPQLDTTNDPIYLTSGYTTQPEKKQTTNDGNNLHLFTAHFKDQS